MNGRAKIDWAAWWQLLRAANVFTAVSNVVAGFLLVQADYQPLAPLLLVALASVLLYEAGMVLNDVCDVKLDARERPERPLPSGRIARQTAYRVGLALLASGLVAAGVVSALTRQWQTAQVAVALAALVVGYNVGAKSTRFGPLIMGGCRMMNVLLGASVAGNLATGVTAIWLFAWGTFFHTYGLTRIARHEADSIDDVDLWIGSAAVVLCPLWIAGMPFVLDAPQLSSLTWVVICLSLLGWETLLAYRLVSLPDQTVVRDTVAALIQMFIVIDAAVAALAVGWLAGMLVLTLLIPTRLMAHKIAMT